ncbi:MAG: hypothetical protein IPM39_17440 [Chloroflexi bacterium]|nr:hypothetical protein [Chloroflexota bacterium]
MKSGVFLGSDTGLRFLQIRELIAQNWQSLAVRYPGQYLDPNFKYVPFYYAYALINNKIYLSISPFLPLLSSLFYNKLGMAGLPVVPVLSSLATAIGVYILGKQQRIVYPHLAMWAAIIATPLIFYTVVLWDHTLIAMCAVWSVVWLAYGWRQNKWWPALLSGATAGIGVGQRPEMYVIIISLALSLLVVFRSRFRMIIAFAVGLLLSILFIWWWQYGWYGHPLGMPTAHNLMGYGKPITHHLPLQGGNPVPQYAVASKFLGLLEARNIPGFGTFVLLMLSIVLMTIGLRRERQTVLKIGFGFSLAGYGLCIGFGLQDFMSGLLPTFPLLVFAISTDPQAKDEDNLRITRFVLTTSAVFLAMMLAVWPAYGGLQWGARYLLPVYPLLMFLAFANFSDFVQRPSFGLPDDVKRMALSLLVISILIQSVGLWQLDRQIEEQTKMRTLIEGIEARVIMTNRPFLPAEMSSVTDKIFLYVSEEADFYDLLPRFWRQGIREFAYVPSEYTQVLFLPVSIEGFRVQQKDVYRYELIALERE